jgi:hypothetical protein
MKRIWLALFAVALLLSAALGIIVLTRTSLRPQWARDNDKQTGPPIGPELSTVPGVSIRRTRATESGSSAILFVDQENMAFRTKDALLVDIIASVVPFECLVLDDAVPEGGYDITVELRPDDNSVWPLLKEALEKSFALRIRKVDEVVDVHVLRRGKDAELVLTPADPEESPSWGTHDTPAGFGYSFRNSTMEDLAEVLQKYAETPVVNETGLDGAYDFQLAMDHWKPKTAWTGVEKLGLELVEAKREITVLRIEKAPRE